MSYHPYAMPPPMPVDPTAVAGKRIAAWLIDGIVFVIVFIVLVTALGLGPTTSEVSADVIAREVPGAQVGSDISVSDAETYCNDWNNRHAGIDSGVCLPNVSDPNSDTGAATIVKGFGNLLWVFLALTAVFIVYQGLLGASLGKLALGLRIVKGDGSRAGVGASAIRTVLWVVDAITCGLPILGGILILATKGHRRIGDMAAGTYVVPNTQVGHPVILPDQSGYAAYPQGPYQPMGQPGGYAPSGPPVADGPWSGSGTLPTGPPGSPEPWAPTDGRQTDSTSPALSGDDYQSDVPIWDEARHAYIQYDSERAAWLEYDDVRREWVPIST